MLMLSTPRDFAVGDTRPAKINGESANVTYRDKHTLVFNGAERKILQTFTESDTITFTCEGTEWERHVGVPEHIITAKGALIAENSAPVPEQLKLAAKK